MGNKTGVRDRIAIFLPSLRGGGAERVMVTLANGLSKCGYSVDLVLASAEGPYLEQVEDSVRIVDLKAGRVLRSLPGLVRYLRQERPKAMLTALTHANVVAIMARGCARVSTRLVISEHSTPSQAAARSTSWVQKAILYGLMRWLYPKADGIVAVSRGVAHDLARFAGLPPDSIQVIYNPFDIKHIQELSKQPLDHPWLAPGQPPVVLGVGRLTEAKDFPTLIRAFARLRAQRPARLMILGEGELREELEALVHSLDLTDDVDLPGFVHNPYAYFARCGVFALSSRWEGLPTVLIEAMACGAPVVATDCPSGPDEILQNGKWGKLVPVGDVDELAKAMDSVLSQPAHPDGKKRAMDFSIEKSIQEYLNVMLRG